MTEIDIDALLAAAGTVREPEADRLLWQLAWSGYERVLDAPKEGSEPWYRYLDWRSAPGHRVICSGCNTAFIRERKNGQLCVNCRRTWQRTCIDCGGAFPAPHPSFKRCPPCREAKRRPARA